MQNKLTQLVSWNRYPRLECTLYRPERYSELKPIGKSSLARGAGLSYGDAALNENGNVILTERINRLLEFDEKGGVLTAEGGITLGEILNVIVPKGWFVPVTPGTQGVTLGGAVAADVHGKNHHIDGSFGQFIDKLTLITPNQRINCSPNENENIFWATIGGMGLTGIISEVRLKLKPIESAYIYTKYHAAENLNQLFDLFSEPTIDDQYSVAWIDCLSSAGKLGRGIFMSGHHATLDELDSNTNKSPLSTKMKSPLSIPVDFPRWALNPLSIKAFNALYYWTNARKQTPFISDYSQFFYPLDNIQNWNRLYGKNGFIQYQCVIPEQNAQEGIRLILEKISSSQSSSFLAVLKRMGPQNKGMLSFPLAGYTLALDLTMNNEKLFKLLNELDKLVIQYGGKVYLAKDARLNKESFREMYPRYDEWQTIKNQLDPNNIISSSLARRLAIGATS